MAQTTSQSLSNAVTLDAVPGSVSAEINDQFHHVGFIEGSRPHIASETAELLRLRLRAAAGVVFLAFAAFLFWRFVRGPGFTNPNGMFYAHLGITAALAIAFASLCRGCEIPLRVLRGYELVIFGLPVAFFLVSEQSALKSWAERGFLPSPAASWMGIAFIYAMFIPNSWRRAALVIGFMCASPILLTIYLNATSPAFAETLSSSPMFLNELVILMGITFLSSIYGTYMIGSLRREAFEARQLGQYRLCRLIGTGGMGDVYLAEHQMMKRPCAIKLIRPGKATDPQALARFEREVRATAKLSHWNTIEIFDYGRTDDGTFYYVMEYLPGLSLAELVDKHGPLKPARAIHLLVQTCDALAEAHAAGLIHRDIKPGNIFSAQRGGIYDVAKLLDFGLAKPISDESVPVQLTQDGAITGSPLFMSPEQSLGDHEPDARSDIYSLGAVAYYILTGTPPFIGDKALKIILAHAQQTVVPPSRHCPDVPSDVEQIVLRCLAKNPLDRYQHIGELRQALSECVAAGGWTHEDAAHWWQANGAKDLHVEALAGSLS